MRLIALRPLAALLILAVPVVAQQPVETMRVNADRTNLRRAPSIDSAIVRTLSKGMVVTVVGHDANWVKVEIAELQLTGWVRNNLLDSISGAPSSMKADPSVTPANPPPPVPNELRSSAVPPPAAVPPAVQAQQLAGAPSSVAPSVAPPGSREHITVDLFGGITLSQVSSGFDQSSNRGIAAGLTVNVPVATGFAFSPTLMYVEEYASATDTSLGFTSTVTDRVDQLNVALLLKPHFVGHGAGLFLNAGPEAIGYFHSNASGSFDGGPFSVSSSQVTIEAGLLAGIGLQLGPIILAGRYDYRLTNGHDHIFVFTGGVTF